MTQQKCTNLAIASVPMQTWQDTYRPETAFTNGTIFPELNLPYIIAGGAKPSPNPCGTANCARGCSR